MRIDDILLDDGGVLMINDDILLDDGRVLMVNDDILLAHGGSVDS